MTFKPYSTRPFDAHHQPNRIASSRSDERIPARLYTASYWTKQQNFPGIELQLHQDMSQGR